MNGLLIRPARPEDAEGLLNIYAPYVLETAVTFEYAVPSVQEFAGRIQNTLKRYPYLAAMQDGQLAGYAYASAFHVRAAYAWAAETSIYIRRDARGSGLGRALYQALEEILVRQGVLNLNACIAYPNPDSIAFHERMGYRTIGHFHQCGFKLGRWHDMIWMEKMLGDHPVPPKAFIPFEQLRDEA